MLKGVEERCGLLIHGVAGVGKSCLAGKLIERFPHKELIVLHGEVKFSLLLPQLRKLFDKKGYSAALDILTADQEPEEKLKALFREPLQDVPTLILCDDFEQNLVRCGDEYEVTTDAREVLIPLLTALDWANGQTNLILTSRYPFKLEIGGENLAETKLHGISLMSLRGADLKKKQEELTHIAQSKHVALYLEFGKGNPRLLEWLDKIAADEAKYDVDALKQAVQCQQEAFVFHYLADILAQTAGAAFHHFLRRAAVFREPVEESAFIRIAGFQPASSASDMENAGFQPASSASKDAGDPGLLRTAVALTLIECEAHRGHTPVYWVTPVIRDSQWQQVAPEDRPALHQLAYRWYDERLDQQQEKDPLDLEEAIYHALASDNVPGACKHAIRLGNYLSEMLLYRERLAMQQQVADRIDDAVTAAAIQAKDENVATLLNNLGFILDTLGEQQKAIDYYEQAVAIDRTVYGDRHPNVARDLNNLGAAWNALGEHQKAIDYYEQAVAIVRATYGEQHPYVASSVNNLGLAWQALEQPQKAIDYYEQALAIFTAVFGPEHPSTRTVQRHLDILLQGLHISTDKK